MIEVCITVHRRLALINEVVECLKKQTTQNFNLNIWNNSGQILNINFPKDRLMIVNSKENVGPEGRFRLAKMVKGETIIFLDDDILIDKDFVAYYLEQYNKFGKNSICGWYSKLLLDKDNYRRDKLHLPYGTKVDYIGTGGMILNRKIFDENPILFNIPFEFKFVEDLYLCYIAQLNCMDLISIDAKCKQVDDGLNFTRSLSHDYKTIALQKLVYLGYNITGQYEKDVSGSTF